jgi:hypothetical protein
MRLNKCLTTLVLGLGVHSIAYAGEYRQLNLSDGRVLYADILQTVPVGLEIALPQGETTIAFELLANMTPIQPTAYLEQESWVVYLYAPEERRETLVKLYQSIPLVDVYGAPGLEGYLTEDQAMAMEGCGGDLGCIAKLSGDLGTPWMWVVRAEAAEDGTWRLQSGVTGSSQVRMTTVATDSRDAWYSGIYHALELTPPAKISRAVEAAVYGEARPEKVSRVKRTPKPEKEYHDAQEGASDDKSGRKKNEQTKEPKNYTAEELQRLGYLPLPGLPALVNGDMGRFGLAMGAALPLTAVWAGAVGKNAQSGGEFVALTTLGFYALSVSINNLIQPKKAPKAKATPPADSTP